MRFIFGVIAGAGVAGTLAAVTHDFGAIKEWSSWAQVYVASLAVIIAIYIPWRIDKEQKSRADEDIKKRALVLAYLVKPEIDDIIFWVDAQIDLFKSDAKYLGDDHINRNIIAMKSWKIMVTPALEEVERQAHLFKMPLAKPYIRMMAELRKYNRHIDDTLEEKAPPLPMSYYKELLRGTLELAKDANRQIRPMLK